MLALLALMLAACNFGGGQSAGSSKSVVTQKRPAVTKAVTKKSDPRPSDVIGTDFKKAMDSYEAFFDEYVAFMKKYQNSTDQATMMSDYLQYLSKYTDFMSKMNALQSQDLNAAELLYYSEVSLRISAKLATIQ